MKNIILISLCSAALAIAAQAQTAVDIVSNTSHDNRTNFGGLYEDTINGSGMNGYDWTTGNTNDFVAAPASWPAGEGLPSTWTATSNQYRDEWQASAILSGATNSKIGWMTLDFGSEIADLDEMYLWNVRENTARGTNAFNIYYASSPTVAPPTGTNGVDYDFGSGGWTLLNTGGALNLAESGRTADDPADGVFSLGGVSAQYIGIEILSNHTGNKVGLAEIGITAVPEPSAFALLSGCFGLAWVILRRRRA